MFTQNNNNPPELFLIGKPFIDLILKIINSKSQRLSTTIYVTSCPYAWTKFSPLIKVVRTWTNRRLTVSECSLCEMLLIGHSKGRQSVETHSCSWEKCFISVFSSLASYVPNINFKREILGNFSSKEERVNYSEASLVNSITFCSLIIQFLLLATCNTYPVTRMETAWIPISQRQNLKVQYVQVESSIVHKAQMWLLLVWRLMNLGSQISCPYTHTLTVSLSLLQFLSLLLSQ